MYGAILRAILGAALLASFQIKAEAATRWATPTSEEIRSTLVDRIDSQRHGVGIVVGVIDPAGRRIVAYGKSGRRDDGGLDGDTIFEIGSVTKVFTALALARTVERGSIALADTAGMYRRRSDTKLNRVTVASLALHTSGLPFMPNNLAGDDPLNPYAGYSAAHLEQFLDSYQFRHDGQSPWAYSNVGYALLGRVLTERTGLSYSDLLRTSVLEPLGMRSTAVTLTAAQDARRAQGHDASLSALPAWRMDAFEPAGGLKSTANDLLTFLAAYLRPESVPLAQAIRTTLAVRTVGAPGQIQALGWVVQPTPSGDVVWQSGATGGYKSFVGFNQDTGTGVVVLSNAGTPLGGTDIGMHILTGSPLAPPVPIPSRAPPRRAHQGRPIRS